MEDFFNNLKIQDIKDLKFNSSNITVALKDIGYILENTKSNDYKFLCAIRTIVNESSHGSLILNGDVSLLKYSWVSSNYTVISILQNLFGFNEKYIERLVRCINKFLAIKSQDGAVLEHKVNYVVYVFDFLNDLTISKMIELLPLSLAQIKEAFTTGDLNIQSSFRDIREYVKSIKGGAKLENKVLEDNSNTNNEGKITNCGLYVKFSEDSFSYIKKVCEKHKSKYKDANAFLNDLIAYAIKNNLFI